MTIFLKHAIKMVSDDELIQIHLSPKKKQMDVTDDREYQIQNSILIDNREHNLSSLP